MVSYTSTALLFAIGWASKNNAVAAQEKSIFETLDTNGDFKLSKEEIKALFFTENGAANMLAKADNDGDSSYVSWEEFQGPKGDGSPSDKVKSTKYEPAKYNDEIKKTVVQSIAAIQNLLQQQNILSNEETKYILQEITDLMKQMLESEASTEQKAQEIGNGPPSDKVSGNKDERARDDSEIKNTVIQSIAAIQNLLQQQNILPDGEREEMFQAIADLKKEMDGNEASTEQKKQERVHEKTENIDKYFSQFEQKKSAFEILDTNSDFKMSKEEIRAVFTEKETTDLLASHDKDDDSFVSWEEFQGHTSYPHAAAIAGRSFDMPAVGLGTAGIFSPSAILSAIEFGYRLLDCAPIYYNEVAVGDAIAVAIKSGMVRREELFVTSKLASPFHRKEHVELAVRKTLTDLRLDYLDLYLIHWPVATKYVPVDPNVRGWPNGPLSDRFVDTTVTVRETWKGMEDLVAKGLVRNIGVSNFPVALLHEILADSRIKPAVNQVELHPYLQQAKLIDYCTARQIKVQAYSPLGTPGQKGKPEPTVLSDPVLAKIANEKKISVPRLCLTWALQRGYSIIAKSSSLDRQRQNLLALTDPLQLSQEEMEQIYNLDKGYRFFRPEDWWGAIGAVFD